MLLLRKHQLFVEQGADGLDEMIEVNAKLRKLEAVAAKDFPWSPSETANFRADLRERMLAIVEVEREAVELLQTSMK